MPLQQVTEVLNRGLVRDEVIAGFDPGKAAHRLAVMKCFFRHWVAQRIPVLQETDPKPIAGKSIPRIDFWPCSYLQRHRRSSALRPHLRIRRINQRMETTPRHHRIHLCQEQLPPRLFPLHCIAKTGKGGLLWHRMGSFQGYPTLLDHAESGRLFRRSLNVSRGVDPRKARAVKPPKANHDQFPIGHLPPQCGN